MNEDFSALRDDYYDHYRSVFGDGEYAMDMTEDAIAKHRQEILAFEDQQRDLILDNQIRFEDFAPSNNDSHPPLQVVVAGGMLISAKAALIALGAVGVLVLAGAVVYRLRKNAAQN